MLTLIRYIISWHNYIVLHHNNLNQSTNLAHPYLWVPRHSRCESSPQHMSVTERLHSPQCPHMHHERYHVTPVSMCARKHNSASWYGVRYLSLHCKRFCFNALVVVTRMYPSEHLPAHYWIDIIASILASRHQCSVSCQSVLTEYAIS